MTRRVPLELRSLELIIPGINATKGAGLRSHGTWFKVSWWKFEELEVAWCERLENYCNAWL